VPGAIGGVVQRRDVDGGAVEVDRAGACYLQGGGKDRPEAVHHAVGIAGEDIAQERPARLGKPMAPYTLEPVLKTMLPSLEAAVDTATKPATGGLFAVKMSVCWPPGTPMLKVPVVPEADISTPFRTPVAPSRVAPEPTAVWR
jgi:hypothetical protein